MRARTLWTFPLLFLSLQGQDPITALEHARTVNLERAAALPNFVVDETATRYRSRHVNPPKWELFDSIESEIAVKGSRFERQIVLRNGKPWKKPDLSDFNWGMSFGAGLNQVFSPKCPTMIEFAGREEARGKPQLAYRFSSPPDGCFATFTINGKQYNPAQSGRVLVEDPGGNQVHFETEARAFPRGFGADPFKFSLTSDYVTIGDASHLLPGAAEVFGGFTKGDLWHVVVEFKNHRHFEASAKVTFEPEKEAPPK